jgi:glycosyltransferase involved in cell wall biosynthesis
LKKICIISPRSLPLIANFDSLSQGGAEAQFKAIGFALNSLGYRISYIVDDYGQSKIVKIGNILIYKVGLKYRGGSNLHFPLSWASLWIALVRINADIYFIKTPKEILFPLGIFTQVFKKKLVFVGQMDTDANPNYIKEKEKFYIFWFYRFGIKLVDLIVAQHNKQKNDFQKYYKKKVKVISNVLTLPTAKHVDFRNKKYILWVGNNLPKKQPELFLKLARHFPNFQFKMIMSVTAQSPDDRKFIRIAREIPNLEYLGFIPFNRIGAYYQDAALFVSTSLHEGFPNTFLQAWQNETPVLSLNIDLNGLIETYSIGRFSGSFEKLLLDIKELMENNLLREQFGKNAKTYAYSFHSLEVIIPQFEKVINNL